MIFNKSKIIVKNVCPSFLNGVPLPYVEDFKHLGHIFQSDNSMHVVDTTYVNMCVTPYKI